MREDLLAHRPHDETGETATPPGADYEQLATPALLDEHLGRPTGAGDELHGDVGERLGGDEQWRLLRELVEDRDPENIVLNIDSEWAFSDGLHAGEALGLVRGVALSEAEGPSRGSPAGRSAASSAGCSVNRSGAWPVAGSPRPAPASSAPRARPPA